MGLLREIVGRGLDLVIRKVEGLGYPSPAPMLSELLDEAHEENVVLRLRVLALERQLQFERDMHRDWVPREIREGSPCGCTNGCKAPGCENL